MSGRMFQSIIMQMKDATDRLLGVIDSEGYVVASSDPSIIGEQWENAASKINGTTLMISDNKTFKALSGWRARFEYAAFVGGADEFSTSMCIMTAVALNGAKSSYEEKYDKATFVKNIITDNILHGDVYVQARELRFVTDVPRAVFLIRQTSRVDPATVDVLQSIFSDRQQDFVLTTSETDVAVVKQVDHNTDLKALYSIAQTIEDTLHSELLIKTQIGIGTVAGHLRELSDSYKEAQVAIEVGKVFDTEKSIINYENLGIGRLIYQLPTTLCEIFLTEVFKKNSIESLDQETLFTINKFFENNLNVSETSRKLFVHRNTLVYRLEKIKKLTGLDLREFDHAIIFKVALMVKKYLVSKESSGYR